MMMKYQELTHAVIGCAMRVHAELGNGFQEVVYQRSLAYELKDTGIGFMRELEMPLHYKKYEVGTRRVDFVIKDILILEIKSVINLEDVHLAQALNYLDAYRKDIGLLINFGARSLQFKRVLSKSIKQSAKQSAMVA